MKINNVELEDIDIFELEVAEKYEKAMNDIKDMEEKTNGLTTVEAIKLQCTSIFDFFNTIFGEGTDRKIFGNKVNLITCLKAFEEFLLQIDKQKSQIEAFKNKYSSNRAQRRK